MYVRLELGVFNFFFFFNNIQLYYFSTIEDCSSRIQNRLSHATGLQSRAKGQPTCGGWRTPFQMAAQHGTSYSHMQPRTYRRGLPMHHYGALVSRVNTRILAQEFLSTHDSRALMLSFCLSRVHAYLQFSSPAPRGSLTFEEKRLKTSIVSCDTCETFAFI